MASDPKQSTAPDTTLSDEAIDWLVRLNSGNADARDHAAFADWRGRSEAHEAAAREAEAIWHGVGLVGADGKARRRKTVTRRAVLGGTAAIAGVGLVGSGVIGPRLFADYVTGVGERRSVVLPDGSAAQMNARTALSLDFDTTERRLRLLEGQATFTVAAEQTRPFSVEAQAGRTTGWESVFDVDIRAADVAVTVLQGTVDVGARDGLGVSASANERVRYGAAEPPTAAETIDAEAETAWRRGKLIFNRRTLDDVVTELERYRAGRIVIWSDDLRALRVTGVFDLGEPDEILATIEQTLPVRVIRLPFVTVLA